jgi:hypothetical protein
MRKIGLLMTLILVVISLKGQVETKFYPNKNAHIQIDFIKNHQKALKVKKFESFDVEQLMKEDKNNEGKDVPFRFGKGFDVDLNFSDGTWVDVDNGRLWSMEFESKGAYSINFVFENFYLPDGAKVYISNSDGTMLYGPVTSAQNSKNGFFLTDLIPGNNVTLYLFEPTEKTNQSKISIKKVVHAYKNLFSEKNGTLGTSKSCNNDVVCFPSWSTESDAVALVLVSNGTELCTGSLLTTTDLSFKSYFLSAFHCIDLSDPRGVLTENEIAYAENWMFKFQYKKTTCGGNSATTGITYNGAQFRAAWNNTDFALLELNSNLKDNNQIAWLGWDRSGNYPTSATSIHHPRGDVMKISFANSNLTPNGFQISWTHDLVSQTNTHWIARLDNGTSEGGSSGAPIFDQNKRVVGQLHGGDTTCAPVTMYYGQFDKSWVGGGTATTRLSNWLDPTNSGQTSSSTSRYPSLSGAHELCSQATYSIDNFPGGATVVWSATPLNIVSIVPNNNTALITKLTNGRVTLSATLNQGLTLTKDIVVGPPLQLCVSSISNLTQEDWDTGYFKMLPQSGAYPYGGSLSLIDWYYFASSYQWSLAVSPPAGKTVFWSSNGGTVNVSTKSASTGITLTCTASNSCGSISKNFRFHTDNFVPFSLILSPNPVSNQVEVALIEDVPETISLESATTESLTATSYSVSVVDSYGAIVYSGTKKEKKFNIPTSSFRNGIYAVIVSDGKNIYQNKLVVKH